MPLSAFDTVPNSDPAQPKHRSATILSGVCQHMRQSGARTLLSAGTIWAMASPAVSRKNFPAVLQPLMRGRPSECLYRRRGRGAWPPGSP